MHGAPIPSHSEARLVQAERSGYVWGIAIVAAMGGLLFGHDWVVIGGARQFYEAYFGLTSEQLIGWANSCALVGCLIGSLAAGFLGDRFGRRRILLVAAILFAISSVFTGWAYSFSSFILWRIVGGTAIGLSSNISPLYIAEVSPASHRGRLVSLNQFAIVIGILLAQVINWRIAEAIPAHISPEALFASWNVQYGWRWMFTAVAVPAVIFLAAAFAIPESPRWLLARGRRQSAKLVLSRVCVSEEYADAEVTAIANALKIGRAHV